jgi:16S rRNA (cytosine967-C5)-methyltransferase
MLDRAVRDHGIVDPDRSFLSELVYGTLRWRGSLDWVIGQFIHRRKLKKLQPEIVEILRLGLYQLLYLKSVPDHAAVNESVELAKGYGYKGASGLVNAVLRRAIRSGGEIPYPDIQANPVGHISARYSHPKWLVKRWIGRYGVDETIQLCSANNLRPPLYLRTNILKTSRDELMRSLQEEGASVIASDNLPESVELTELSSPMNELSAYKLGWFQVQDESSILASHILDPQPGETIIDACAAPGGKSTHIAELMGNRGKVLAFDVDERRLPTRWRRTVNDLKTFPELQYEILASAARCVKPGGVLLYCTCSIEPEENQQVVERFLDAHPQFQIEIPPNPPLVKGETRGLPLAKGGRRGLPLAKGEIKGYMQAYPHLHGMDGFFAARMIKL